MSDGREVIYSSKPERSGGLWKILLVDDEQGFLKILDTALSKYFETYTATGVQEAIDILKQNAIDLICSDWI